MRKPINILTLSILSILTILHSAASPATGLDGTTGNICKVNPERRSFELLKETEYDPKTDLHQSRFTVYWTDDTAITKIEEATDFGGIKQPVTASFHGIDASNSKALEEGKPFIARVATLFYRDTSTTSGETESQRVIGRFTPSTGANPRSGMLELNGKPVEISLRKSNSRIFVHQPLQPADLAKGFWKTTIHGAESGGRFLIRRMEVQPLVDSRATDDPKLPRVLVVGDSISMNYHEAAKAALKGIANYHRNEGNSFSTAFGVTNMELWLGDWQEPGLHWDVIQFNHGLHNLKQTYDAATDRFGDYAVPLEDYKKNLEKEISILKKTGVKLIWCSTTPVPYDNKGTYARRKGADREVKNPGASPEASSQFRFVSNEASFEECNPPEIQPSRHGCHEQAPGGPGQRPLQTDRQLADLRQLARGHRCALLQGGGAEAARRGGRLSGPQGTRQRRGGMRALSCGHPAFRMPTFFQKQLSKRGCNNPKRRPVIPISNNNPIMSTTQLNRPAPPEAAASSGALGPEFLASLRKGYVMSAGDRACHNAVTNNAVNSLALNRAVLRGNDGHFSHRIKSNGITDQKQSGRCWMFAGLNTLRPQVMRDHRMAEFQFSTAYLQFWDKMEKSNVFLESIIELRDADYLDRDWELVNKFALEDGGWWNYLAGLVEKYGVVPLSAMPETHASTHTKPLNHILGRMLRAQAVQIIKRHEDGVGIDELRAAKNEALKEVYRFLAINFGEPPEQFEWRYQIRKPSTNTEAETTADMRGSEDEDLTPPEIHTPRSFYQKYVGSPLADFVCLYNDPHNELDRHYCFDRTRNIVGNACMHFINIDSAPMKEIAKSSILANEPVWFAVNMDFDQSQEHGLMEHQLFDYETLFKINLNISKADRTRFHAGASCHAMALMGVDLDKDGSPLKWLVENSHGDHAGDKGRWTLLDKWFDEHVYTIVVHKRHVPAGILKRFEEQATVLPAWYPGAKGIRFHSQSTSD